MESFKMFVKYDNICRICLDANGLYKLSELSEYGETFMKLTEITTSHNDENSFPDNICQRCRMYLKICHKFRLTAIESNEKLITFLNNVNKNIESVHFNTEAVNKLSFNEVKILLSKEDHIEITNLEKEIVHKNLETIESNKFEYTTNNNFVECSMRTDAKTEEEYLDDSFTNENNDNLSNSDFVEDDTDCNTKDECASKRINKLRKFKEFWLDLHKPWLTEINGKAYCKYCSTYLENILAHIKRHSHTTKHEKNSLIFNELKKQDEIKLEGKLSNKNNTDNTDNIVILKQSSMATNSTDKNQVVNILKKSKTTKINMHNSSSLQTKVQIRRFKEYWGDIYKPWLCEINGQAHCRYCCSKIENILRHIERHLSTTKHQRNALIYLETGKEIPSEKQILEFLKDCKQIVCDYCEKSFSSKEILDSHINRSHVDDDGVARFQCAQCNKKFSLISTVKNHLKNHPIHKAVFTCYNCKEKFARKGTLKNHMFQCIKNFESGSCFDCNVHFKDFDSYLYHFNEVHRTPDFDIINENCWICGNNFNSASELREHLLEHDIIEL